MCVTGVNWKVKFLSACITSSAAGISNAYVTGKLGLYQQNPIQISTGISDTQYNYNFTIEASKYSINDIFTRFTNRNKTIDYDYKTNIRAYGDPDTTTVNIRMFVPGYDLTVYYPGYLESIKLAWIQYCKTQLLNHYANSNSFNF